MASHTRRIPTALKRQLVDELGGKCANPGCSSGSSHIHHIKHWAVYKSHDESEMIALCPTCHHAAHYGLLQISDEALYKWKGILRPHAATTAHIYVEPAPEILLLTGSVAITSRTSLLTVLHLSGGSKLELRVLDHDFLQLNIVLVDASGTEVLRVVENNVRTLADEGLLFQHRPGRVRLLVPASARYLPSWLVPQMLTREANFVIDNRYLALDLEMIRPGVVRVCGCWPSGDKAVVISTEQIYFCKSKYQEPLTIEGCGESTRLAYEGPISGHLFSIFLDDKW